MALTVNTNIPSLNTQRNLNGSSNALATSMQRLSTGSRINGAKDDAAGLQISNRMTSQINGLNVAVRNANDGISIAQTAEGSLQQTTNILQRMRDLALQSANGGNGDNERKALNDEVVQLKSELDRIASTTRFGSKSLFDGSFAENIQVGANANETISVAINSFRTTDMGTSASRDALAAKATATSAPTSLTVGAQDPGTASVARGSEAVGTVVAGDLTIGTLTVTLAGGETAEQVASKINAAAKDAGGVAGAVEASVGTGIDAGKLILTEKAVDGKFSGNAITVGGTQENNVFGATSVETSTGTAASSAAADDKFSLTVVDEDGSSGPVEITMTGGTYTSLESLADDINRQIAQEPTLKGKVRATVDEGKLSFVSTEKSGTASITVAEVAANTGFTKLGFTGATTGPQTGTAAGAQSEKSVELIDISSVTGAQDAIATIDAALAEVDTTRASLGAVQNRFESTIANLQNVAENTSASRGRIMDTDFAAETANLSKNQILQQAGTAILAQAKQLPQAVLSLLQ
ncbi:flagellin [Stutzerimonas kunmingensis]|uniref:flagellin n=1 Tax=Stutzerimonas kunmingensis TaxID=1211807 RepID=UPI00241D1BCB|nr:flagellin [Stutzerimonas kunmingensis]